MKTLLIDNYDSFTFNLFQLLASVNGHEPIVIRNDEMTWKNALKLSFDNIVISPGPGHPAHPSDFGLCQEAIAKSEVPLLGVCLGHQGIALGCGGRIGLAPEPVHGRPSPIHHLRKDLFSDIPSPFTAIRYHSWIVEGPLPDELEPLAWTSDDLLMAFRHRKRPLWGVQFHPESIGTEFGRTLLENFKALTESYQPTSRYAPRPRAEPQVDSFSRAPKSWPRPSGSPISLKMSLRMLPFEANAETLFSSEFASCPHAFWLDSATAVSGFSRFSYLGDARGPHSEIIRYRVADRSLTTTRQGRDVAQTESVFDSLDKALAERFVARSRLPKVPFDFVGGYVGYFGYEMRHDCTAGRPNFRHRSPVDDSTWIFADRFVAIDHLEKKTYIVQWTDENTQRSPEAQAWERHIENAASRESARDDSKTHRQRQHPRPDFKLRHSRPESLTRIHACLEAIRLGQSYELCLTNSARANEKLEFPLEVYRELRKINPAPFAAYLRFGDLEILSSSPERFLKIDASREMEAKPIKGTAPRGRTPDEDASRAFDLQNCIKDRAENLMIVDLLRNDMGSIAEIGSVHVPHLMVIESYATVHQLVSTVRARLKENLSPVDAVRALFPGGSMTGAPKKRTMEILDELEGSARGVYSGALGYFSLDGAADFSIVIRTIVTHSGGTSIGAGGAIIALSDPEAEIEEMWLKAQAPLRVFEPRPECQNRNRYLAK